MSASAYGHEMEVAVAQVFLDNFKVEQSGFDIIPESIVTNQKLKIAGDNFSENDGNLSLLKETLFGKRVIDIAIQSKRYNDPVSFEKVLHDLIKIKLSSDIGRSLTKRTIVMLKQSDSDLEKKLKHDFHAKIILPEDLAKHHVVEEVGSNTLSMLPLGKKKSVSIDLGNLYLLDEGWFNNKLGLYNIIKVNELNQHAFDRVTASLEAPRMYLTPEIYLYVSTNGISPHSLMWLNKINAYGTLPGSNIPLTVEHLNGIVKQGDLLEFFKPLNYNTTTIKVKGNKLAPFALGKKFLGEQEDKLYYPLDKYVYKYDRNQVTYQKLAMAVLKFLGEI